jgi:predicted transglutaminase-like cysteine proteinase
MRQTQKMLAAIAVLATAGWTSYADAAFFSFPRILKTHTERVTFNAPVLAPIAHTRFCVQYPEDCQIHRMGFLRSRVKLTPERWAELISINLEVNRAIVPQRNQGGVLTEEWLISPKAGDCNDYAVTKRHELLARGWPSRALLLSEVVTTWGEHHLVLVVRSKDGDVVLDNLNANIRPVAITSYRWVRAQSPSNPNFWSSVSVTTMARTAMLLRERSQD